MTRLADQRPGETADAPVENEHRPVAPSFPVGLGARSKLVYLHLYHAPGATARQLSAELDLASLALLPTLRALEGHGLVERDGQRYRCRP